MSNRQIFTADNVVVTESDETQVVMFLSPRTPPVSSVPYTCLRTKHRESIMPEIVHRCRQITGECACKKNLYCETLLAS